MTVIVVLLALGLPVALALSWAFQLTPEGVEATRGRLPTQPTRDTAAYVAFLRGNALLQESEKGATRRRSSRTRI